MQLHLHASPAAPWTLHSLNQSAGEYVDLPLSAKPCLLPFRRVFGLFTRPVADMTGRRSARSSLSAATNSLPAIPEMAAPGGNAFAQKELQRERYQLAGNAFAQQEFAQRKMTPPGMVHPAFRRDCNILDTTKALPELDPAELQHHMQHPPQRESSQTTMTQFIQASPELDLGTTPEHTPVPTQREWLETRDNLELHGGEQSYIPVFKHTPKVTAEEFAAAGSTTPKEPGTARPQTPATKSPKKGFFERMSKWTGRRTQPQTPKLDTDVDRVPDSHMPPKARAVLHEAPPPRSIIRSPSKAKSFFSRRQSDVSDSKRPEPPRSATSLGHRTPRSVHFESPKPSAPQSRNVSGATIPQRTPRLGRSQSLKCLDSPIPPTPPAKDTPPDQAVLRNVSQPRTLPTSANETPSKIGNFLSAGRLSPSCIGNNGNRGAATLVTQPSTYSFRASVVPGAMDEGDLEDANMRLRGLAIEGFNMPHETRRDNENVTYSPSIYSPDQFRKSVARFPERETPEAALARIRREAKEEDDRDRKAYRDSLSTAQSSFSTTGTIPIVYPELAKDPSIASFMKYDLASSSPAQPGAADQAYDEVERMLHPKKPVKDEKIVERVRRDSEATVKGEYVIASPRSAVSELSADGLFAVAVKRVQSKEAAAEQPSLGQATPSKSSPEHRSPMAHHPSAVPSPLRTIDGEPYLPATTYTPTQQPRSRKHPKNQLKLPKVEEKKSSETLLSPYDAPWTPGGRPKPKGDIFSNKPSLIPRPREGLVIRKSPPVGGGRWSNDVADSTGDPQKSPTIRKVTSTSIVENAVAAIEQQESQKSSTNESEAHRSYNDLMEMITVRDAAITELQTEVKFETTRLHHRLASMEIKDRERAKLPEVCFGDDGKPKSRKTSMSSQTTSRRGSAEKRPAKRQQPEFKRVSTTFAHEYYQARRNSNEATSPANSVPASEQSTIILTPNLPKFPPLPNLPPPPEQPREDSPTLPPGSPGPVATAGAKMTALSEQDVVPEVPASADAKYNELIAVVQQQQTMMMQMMQEIKDLKRAGKGPGSGE